MSTPDGGENSQATAGPLVAKLTQVVRLEDLNEVVHTLVRQAMAGSGEQAMAGGGEQQNPIAGSSDPCSGGKEG